jgi:hydroxyethylthiazole kinase-like uncharacterized protein yjeF
LANFELISRISWVELATHMTNPPHIQIYLDQLYQPSRDSHKGQNGKLLVIGGSELFHAAGKWALDAASKFADMVFYSSIPSNNELIKQAKGEFWNGIVVAEADLASYVDDADCILIGPGMTRDAETKAKCENLFKKYPDQKWVIDAGALQVADPRLFPDAAILTPHAREFALLQEKIDLDELLKRQIVILLKGEEDTVMSLSESGQPAEQKITGGNAGMTKGGSGDILAGVVAALYCKNEAVVSAVVGSYVNKKAAEILAADQGEFYNASDLAETVGRSLHQAVS